MRDMPPPSSYKHALNDNMTATEDGGYISILQWIQRQIDTSPDKTIRMKITDIKKALYPEFENKKDYVIYKGIRHALLHYGIYVRRKIHKRDYSQVLIMSLRQYDHDKR
jgi:hypothetical protein